jgi:hypothetical protein
MKSLVFLFLMVTVGLTLQQRVLSQTATAQPQNPGEAGSANRIVGEVTAIDAAGNQLTVRSDNGNAVVVVVDDKTNYMKALPGARNLEGATRIAISNINVGDRVLALGRVSEDQKTVSARAVVVMTKADIAQKQEHDRAEWRRRGVAGVISAINPETKEITVNSRSRAGIEPVILVAGAPNVVFRRYAPDSVKFSDAKSSTFAELKVGDQVRALGEKSQDGSRFTPEEIVSGVFRTITGQVLSINPELNEIRITDTKTGQPVTAVLRGDSLLKRIPPEMSAMMAMRAQGQGTGPGGPGRRGGAMEEGGARRPADAPGGMGRGRGRMGGGFDFQDILERLPATSPADLKVGEVVVVSSTAGADPGRVTAIAVVAGVDALLSAMQPRETTQGARPGPGAAPAFGSDFGFGIGLP